MAGTKAGAAKGWAARWEAAYRRGDYGKLGAKGLAYVEKREKQEADSYEFEYEGPAWELEWEWDY